MVSQEFCDTSGFDSEVGQRKGSAKVRHCQQQRSYCVLREADDESDVLGMSPWFKRFEECVFKLTLGSTGQLPSGSRS